MIRWAWSAHSSDGGGGTRIHAMDIEGGGRRRSREPTAVRPALGLGWPESAWLDRDKMPGRVTRILRMEWKRDAGRARLPVDRVEGGDSRRTGPSRTMIQDVPLEVGHV